LRGLDDFAVQFGRRCLVESDVFLEPTGSDGVEQTKSTEAIHVASVFGHLEGDFDVRLGSKVVYLGRLYLSEDVHQIGTVGQIAIVQLEFSGTWSISGWLVDG